MHKMYKHVTVHGLSVSPLGLFNRDRANLPKEANYGGVTRARRSSQFKKRHLFDRLIADAGQPASIRSQYTVASEILADLMARLPKEEPAHTVRRNQLNHTGHVVYETIFRNDPDFTTVRNGKLDERKLRDLRDAIDVEFYKQDDAILFGIAEIDELRKAIVAAWEAVEKIEELDKLDEWPSMTPI